MKKSITIDATEITIIQNNQEDYINLSDMARYRDKERTDYIIQNWLRTRYAIEFLGLWEKMNNPLFNSIEFDGIKNQSGSNSFILTPKQWISKTNSIGIISKQGRHGGTFAHKDIAFEFGSWLSPEFKFYLIREFQRLKTDENDRLKQDWDLQRTLSKINYRIHTDAIKEYIIPQEVSPQQISFTYANEADLLNVALFSKTASQWRMENPHAKGNIRDKATLEQLIVLSNLESINAELIHQNLSQSERLIQLNRIAITQMKSLSDNEQIELLKNNNL